MEEGTSRSLRDEDMETVSAGGEAPRARDADTQDADTDAQDADGTDQGDDTDAQDTGDSRDS